MKDEATMLLLRSGARALESDRADLKEDVRQLRSELRRVETDLASVRTENAILKTRLGALQHSDKLRGALKTTGGLFIGAGLSVMTQSLGFGFAGCTVGVIFVVAGWVWPDGNQA